MNDPCHQEDAQIDKALGQDWPAKRGADLVKTLRAEAERLRALAFKIDELIEEADKKAP